jgi:hypothetical protein
MSSLISRIPELTGLTVPHGTSAGGKEAEREARLKSGREAWTVSPAAAETPPPPAAPEAGPDNPVAGQTDPRPISGELGSRTLRRASLPVSAPAYPSRIST